MPKFFVEYINGENHLIIGEDAKHIIKSLRMRVGDDIIICDTLGYDYSCKIYDIGENLVSLKILSRKKCESEPSIKVTLYQGLPKGEKMDLIVQKSVELGVFRIVPVMMTRCISMPSSKSLEKKIIRWNKIAESAAKQSGRGIIPSVENMIKLNEALNFFGKDEKVIFFYEGGGESLGKLVKSSENKISIFIGPEGGFSLEEVEFLKSIGTASTLGKRILRTETAPIAALSAIMYVTGNME